MDGPAHDVRLADPCGFGVPGGDTVYPVVQGHGGYQLDDGFAAAVSRLLADLPQPPQPPGAAPGAA